MAFDDGNGAAAVTTGTMLTYTVQFSEVVTGVDVGDFSNRGTSAVTFGTFTPVDGDTYTIQVTPTTPGTLQLQLNAIGTGIIDAVGNGVALPICCAMN